MSYRVEVKGSVLRLFVSLEDAEKVGTPIPYLGGWLAASEGCLFDDAGKVPGEVLGAGDISESFHPLLNL